MKIHLLAFASAGDAVGATSQDVELPAGSTLGDLKALLDRQHPGLTPLWGRLAVAVDGEIAAEATPLADGAEVALLPPVSGGSGAVRPATEIAPVPAVALTAEPLDAAALAAVVAGPTRGAVVLFLGTVRNHHRGRAVGAITYSAYESMAEARIRRILAELEAAEEDLRLALHHRLGRLVPGQASVIIAAAAPHRPAAYAASREALERLKAEVPIWKREHYGDGTAAWREEESLRPPDPPDRR